MEHLMKRTSVTPVMVPPTITKVMVWPLEVRITRTLRTAGPVMLISTDSRKQEDWQIRLTIL
jgi:hypothetical protein